MQAELQRMTGASPAEQPSLSALADQCVMCGLCLPHCPTYALSGLEAESPRGRIQLISAAAAGQLAATQTLVQHLDQCLSCGQCEAVCPAQVQYGRLIEVSRSSGVTDPARQRRAARWAQLLGSTRALGALAFALRLLPASLRRLALQLPRPWRWLIAGPAPRPRRRIPERQGAAPVYVFPGCASSQLDPAGAQALLRLIAALGYAPSVLQASTCCGALAQHAGLTSLGARIAAPGWQALVSAGAQEVIGLVSGCHAVLAEQARSHGLAYLDALSWLARPEHGPKLRFRACSARVLLHRPCSSAALPTPATAWVELLGRIPGLQIETLAAGYGCCGAAGDALLHQPQRTAAMVAPLLTRIHQVQPDYVLSSNVGCAMLLRAELIRSSITVTHPLALLAECLEE